jgi:16S rRNA (cytidine1402-2'-O)-methyltransferase
MGNLYLVATPIGNLEDITARALHTLQSVHLIAAEDTRHTRKLLSHFDIHVPLTSYFEHNKYTKLENVLKALEEGDVALVSDAGTPALNDPGYELVREALSRGYTIIPIPGACAPITALVASGLPSENFLYLGYLPRKANDRRRLLLSIANLPFTLIFLETPHRLLESLKDLESSLGNRLSTTARELTKIHEEIFRGTLQEAQEHFSINSPRGEFTLVIAGAPSSPSKWDEDRLLVEISEALANQESPSQIATRLARESKWSKRNVYRLIHNFGDLHEPR